MTAIPKPSMKKRKKIKKKLSLPKLIEKADRVFAKYIRQRDEIELHGRCCTCGAPGNQAGHFIKRGEKKVRWHEQNVHLQCVRCNHFLSGNEAVYALFIVNKYGADHLRWLHEQKGTYKPSREELENIIRKYEDLT